MDIQKLPYYLFLIIRPDGNTAFSRIHENYPLQLDINQLLTLGSNLNNLNTMQAEIIHPDIKNNRQDEIDLAKNSSIKSISASTFQMRFLDTVSGYMFIISGSNSLEQRKLDLKLDQVYKAFVDYVIKAPFFNVLAIKLSQLKRWTIPSFSKNATKYCTAIDRAYRLPLIHDQQSHIHFIDMETFENYPSDDEPQHALTTTHQRKIQNQDYRLERERYIEPAINLPSRHYSLQPDCIAGWKPKQASKPKKPKYFNPFPLRYDEEMVDELIRELVKNKEKHNEALIYLGPRRQNSYALHQNRSYPNPYRFERSTAMSRSQRSGVATNVELRSSYLKFDSDFESGNLDAVVQRASAEFDLFMRVDTNTRGHTNWFYFQVRNEVFIGSVTFTICNFRRPVSLYQRGLRPYVSSKSKQDKWVQAGEDVKYERQRLRYKFLYGDSPQMSNPMLNSFYALTFSYKFQMPHDQVRFAYCPPYPYSQLTAFLSNLNNIQLLPSLKALSGLAIPVLKISDDQDDTNKKVALMTARIHPGQSNSSYVVEGFLEFVCSSDPTAREIRSKYIFYVVPMLNPDGVVAGNYRTSLFGKDLNRTFNQSRRFAFPEVYQLLRLGEDLKKRHKNKFCLYLDLHGHSIKKNVFMYGPDYALQDSNYEICRELPRILGGLTPYFRYYSCSFRISDQKSSTGRAIFNRNLKIPYTYTMQSSNGSFFDWLTHAEVPFSEQRWKEMGVWLAKGLNLLKLQKLPKIVRTHTLKIKKMNYLDHRPQEHMSDDDIDENDSDIDAENQDLPEEILKQIENAVKGNREEEEPLKKSFDSGSLQGVPEKKKKPKLVQDATKRTKIEKITTNQSRAQKGCALQVPQRKNISFPLVFPVHRTEIFVSRQSRHQKYQKPLQLRFRRQVQGRRMESGKKSVSSSKMQPQEIEMSRQEMHFHDLIKKYKFNF